MCGKTITIILQGREEKGKPPTGNVTTVTRRGRNNKKWEEGLDPRIIRERYELFIHNDLSDVDIEVDFEDSSRGFTTEASKDAS